MYAGGAVTFVLKTVEQNVGEQQPWNTAHLSLTWDCCGLPMTAWLCQLSGFLFRGELQPSSAWVRMAPITHSWEVDHTTCTECLCRKMFFVRTRPEHGVKGCWGQVDCTVSIAEGTWSTFTCPGAFSCFVLCLVCTTLLAFPVKVQCVAQQHSWRAGEGHRTTTFAGWTQHAGSHPPSLPPSVQ